MPGNIHLTTFLCSVLAGLAPFYPNGLSENKNVTEIHGVPYMVYHQRVVY